jgi:hypothetical protein
MAPPTNKLARQRRQRIVNEQREYILSKTDNGSEAVDFMLALARDAEADAKDRKAAWEWIYDRGVGKAAERHEHEHFVDDVGTPEVDLSQLSLEELRDYERLHAKLAGIVVPALPPAPVEAPDAEAELLDLVNDGLSELGRIAARDRSTES